MLWLRLSDFIHFLVLLYVLAQCTPAQQAVRAQSSVPQVNTFKAPERELKVRWTSDVTTNKTKCVSGGTVAGELDIELHLLIPDDDRTSTWVESAVFEHREPDKKINGKVIPGELRQIPIPKKDWKPLITSPCAPKPGPKQRLVSFTTFWPSPKYHNFGWKLTVRYGWRTDDPAPGFVTPHYDQVSTTLYFDNLILDFHPKNPEVLTWHPDNSKARRTTVRVKIRCAQKDKGFVRLDVYRLGAPLVERMPFKRITLSVTIPVNKWMDITWDGTDDKGQVVEEDMYGYDVLAWHGKNTIDGDRRLSGEFRLDP